MAHHRSGRKVHSRGLAMLAMLAMLATLILPADASAQPGTENGNGPPERGATIADRYIVVLRDGVNPAGFAQARDLDPDVTFSSALNGFAATIPAQALRGLARNPHVLLIEPDSIMTVDAPPSGVDRVDADENPTAAIDGSPATGSSDIDIAVLDTGVDTNHPDLNVAGGAGYAGISVFGIFWVCDDGTASYEDGHGHGTHVSGTIAALDDAANSGSTEVVGVVPGARIWGVKVLDDSGSGATSCIINGIDWVTQQKLDYQSSGGAIGTNFEVANMSLGGGNSAALCAALGNSVAAGIVYAVAAGNSATDAAGSSPANCSSALTVSAIADFDGQPGGLDDQTVSFSICTEDTDDSFACFSNYGSVVDIAAPGVNILSTVPGGGYGTSSGTSMASPHVAGAVGLFLEAGNTLADMSGTAVTAALTSAGWTVPQASACGFDGDPDGSAEPMVYAGSSCLGPPTPVTDVAITAVSAPASVEGGDPATVSVTVTNEGNQDVADVTVTLTTSRGVITDSPQTVSLTAGSSTVVDFDWNTVGIGPGDTTLTASHDIADDDPSDNSATTTSTVTIPPAPITDIAITEIAAPQSVEAGEWYSVLVTVANQGNQDVSGINVALTTTEGTINDSPQTISLDAGNSIVVSFTWDTTSAADGSATLTASHDVDDDDPSDDSDTRTSTVTTPPPPVTDIAITGVTAPASVEVGQSATVSVAVENQGNQDVSDISVTLTASDGEILNSPQTVSLAADSSTVVNFTWDTTGAAPVGDAVLTASHDVADDDTSDDSAFTTASIVDPPPPQPGSVHVGDLDGSSSSQGKTWTATVTIRVHDGDENPVAGATVSGSWSGAAGGSTSCPTGGSGSCVVSVSGIPKKTKAVTFTVANVAAAEPYESGNNHDPDNDSNGTSISLRR